MKIIFKYYIFLAFVCFSTISCSDYLEEVPKSLISPENFYKTENDALASLYSVYDAMGSGNGVYYRWYRCLTLFLSDEGCSSPETFFQTVNYYTYDSKNVMISEIWNFSYNAINRSNATIDNVSQMDIDDVKKNQIVGEAKFLRALNYFNLVRFYGPIPAHLSAVESMENAAIEASSIEDIYSIILEDLSFAEQYVPIRVRGTVASNGRADLAAVKMLLAKVYMTMAGYPLNDQSKWPLALLKTKELYNTSSDFGFSLWDNYLDAFEPANENGKEDIFSIQFKSGIGAPFVGEGSLQHIDCFNQAAGRRGNYINRPTVLLKQMFETDDERGQAITDYRMVSGVKYPLPKDNYMFFKYVEQAIVDANTAANDGNKNFPVFRYAELLLMCAETENEVNGPTAFAYDCLNKVRIRSNISGVSGLTKDGFREVVLDERMRELYDEGSRWWDLVRYHRVIEQVTKAHDRNSSQKPNIPTEKNYWLPYPLDELSYNPYMQQREGY